MTTGQRMSNRRKELCLSAERIAELLGVSPATIYRYENGSIDKIPGDRLAPIADALQTTPAYLMGWEDAPATTHPITPTDALTSAEQSLLMKYRDLNEEGQEKLLDYADDLSQSGKYKKSGQLEMVDKEA